MRNRIIPKAPFDGGIIFIKRKIMSNQIQFLLPSEQGRDFMVPNHPEVIALRKRERYNAYHLRYNQSEKFKSYKKSYLLRPEVKLHNKEYIKKWRNTPQGKLSRKIQEQNPIWRAKHNAYIRKYIVNRLKTDPIYKTRKKIRDRLSPIKSSLSNKNIRSNSKAIVDYIGLPPNDGQKYHIDHIKPLCSFNLNNPKQVKLATAPKNHRWLLAKENLRKATEDRKKSIKYGIKR